MSIAHGPQAQPRREWTEESDMRLKDMRAPTKQPKLRQYITKSRSGHYTATIRNERGVLVHVDWGLSTLEDARRAARAAIAKATGEQA